MMPLLFILACSPEPPEQAPSPEPLTEVTPKPQSLPPQDPKNWDQGQQHPPIPTHNPIWEWDAKGFVPDYGWFGEHSWTDVRMRVLGHLSIAGRDHARVAAERHDLQEAAERYDQLVAWLEAVPIPQDGHANEIARSLIGDAKRDARLLHALANGEVPQEKSFDLAELRRRYYALALSENPAEADLKALQQELLPYLEPNPDLAIDAFEDFVSRHALRTRLFVYYGAALDPLGISERWGYWTDSERSRQALCIGWALGKMGGDDWTPRLEAFQGSPLTEPQISNAPAIYWPSAMAEQLQAPDMAVDFSQAEFAWLPTGDSLIDVAGQPGPLAIGTLMKLGADDTAYQAWLAPHLSQIQGQFEQKGDVLGALQRTLQALDEAYDYGSLFYTKKQIRNATLRQLARSRRFDEAYAVHQLNFPLHHQDWACPNRAGLLQALGGRLLAEAGRPDAESALLESIRSSQAFLEQVTQAEQGKITGPRPPQLSPQGQGPGPVHRPPGAPPPPKQGPRPPQ